MDVDSFGAWALGVNFLEVRVMGVDSLEGLGLGADFLDELKVNFLGVRAEGALETREN